MNINGAAQSPVVGKLLFSIGSRLLISYLVFNYFVTAKAAELGDNSPSSCSQEKIDSILTQSSEEDINRIADELFQKCRQNFLQSNQIEPVVKEAVDKWLNLDLSKASPSERWTAYQMALMNESISGGRAKNKDEKFVQGCKRMIENYETFRDNTSQLADYIDIESAWWSASGGAGSPSNDLNNYAQYSLFCHSLIEESED